MSLTEQCFTIRCTDDGSTYTLACTGELDAAATPGMREALLRALNSRRGHISVDLALLTFIDSSGINYLLLAHKAAEIAGLEMTFVPPHSPARRTLQLAGVDELLAFTD